MHSGTAGCSGYMQATGHPSPVSGRPVGTVFERGAGRARRLWGEGATNSDGPHCGKRSQSFLKRRYTAQRLDVRSGATAPDAAEDSTRTNPCSWAGSSRSQNFAHTEPNVKRPCRISPPARTLTAIEDRERWFSRHPIQHSPNHLRGCPLQ